MAEHSMCQPGRPGAAMPAGEGHDGSACFSPTAPPTVFDGFHSTKSIGSFLYGATSTRAPATISSSVRLDSLP